MHAPDQIRLQNQVDDAAGRLHRTTQKPVLAFAVQQHPDGGTGVAYAGREIALGEIEFGVFVILNQLSADRAEGANHGCEDCAAAKLRIDAAIAALLPGFGGGMPTVGRC